MIRYALIFALTSLVAAVGYAGWVTVDRNALSDELAAVIAQRDQALRGAAELERFVRDQRKRDEAARRVLDDLKTGDFNNADTPLDPHLRSLIDCLRRETVDCHGTAGLPD